MEILEHISPIGLVIDTRCNASQTSQSTLELSTRRYVTIWVGKINILGGPVQSAVITSW